MALPTSGQISLLNICNELGINPYPTSFGFMYSIPNASLGNIAATAGYTTPYSIGDFYTYPPYPYAIDPYTEAGIYINAVVQAGYTGIYNFLTAIENLFYNLITQGLYDKIYGFYPMLGNSSYTQRINAKSVNGFRQNALDLSFYGGWTFDQNYGARGNGVNTYWLAEPEYYTGIPQTYTNSTITNSHFGTYQSEPDYYGLYYQKGWDISVYGNGSPGSTDYPSYVAMSNNYYNDSDGNNFLGFGYDTPNDKNLNNVWNDPASQMMSIDDSFSPPLTTYKQQGSPNGVNTYSVYNYPATLPSETVVGGGLAFYPSNNGYTFTTKTYGFITFGSKLSESEMDSYQFTINQFMQDTNRSIYN
jgi:hypothetical protein